MKKVTILSKIFVTALFIFLFLAYLPVPYVYAKTGSEWYDSGEFRGTTYYRVQKDWLNYYQEISNVETIIKVSDMKDSNSSIECLNNEEYASDVFNTKLQDQVLYSVNVEKTGLYYLVLDYKYDTEFSNNPTISVKINDKYQYNEAEEINLDVSWTNSERDEADKYNRYGDELLPYTVPINKWYHGYISDAFSELEKPNMFLLTEGVNNILIEVQVENLILGNLTVTSYNDEVNYSEYISSYKECEKVQDKITIQAENISLKNDIEVKGAYYKSYKMTPASYKSQVLNMLSGGSSQRNGVEVGYTFNVEKTGLYNISFKYKQNTLAGLAVGKKIKIDGVVPFTELNDYLFPYQKKWTNYTLNNNGENYYFYLEKGTHTISLESTTSHVINEINDLYDIMDSINNIGITINTITGSSSNTQITWKIEDYLPTISSDLMMHSTRLMEIYDYINSLNPTTKQASEVSSLKIAANQLERLAKKPNKIQNKLSELNSGSGSAYQLIGNAIGYLLNQSMDIDYIAVHDANTKLPKANGNFFGRLWFSVKGFFYSFFDKRYNIKLSDDANTIDIMVNSSNLYTNIIQELADDEFTKETGIKVQLTILSNTQAIILNNATNTNPDGIIEMDSWLPYTYALRGILEDLSKYEGFDEITKDIYSSNFTPLIYEDGVYGIPETQGMQLLFYRTDILDSLGLSAPNTWDDVLKMLPTLQSYQMNFYHPLGYDSAYKGFSLTTPFFYMYDSEVYSENGFSTCINEENAIEAIQFMTDLFNIYNLPQQVGSFFENFRSGTLPVGIAGVDLYLQLKYACPELSGQWGVLPIPGMLNEETGEVERWSTTYGKCSIMFAKSEKKEQTWKFLKWWHSESTQNKYVQNIKVSLGEKYLIVPANIEVLNASPWDEEIKNEVIKAAKWSRIPAITPGSYIIEREISNIWNAVVINKENVRVAVNESVPKINRELRRKFEEFKYLKDGVVLKEYVVPNNDNIHRWVKGRDYYE